MTTATQRIMRILASLTVSASSSAWAQTSPPVILEANVVTQYNEISILGRNLAPSPVVALQGKNLTVIKDGSSQILASLPAGLAPGTYQLSVTVAGLRAIFDLTYQAPLALPFSGTSTDPTKPAFVAIGAAAPVDGGPGDGIQGYGGAGMGFNNGGDGVTGVGGDSSGAFGGRGVFGVGGNALVAGSPGGAGVEGLGGTGAGGEGFGGGPGGNFTGGESDGTGTFAGDGLDVLGGFSASGTGGEGIYAQPGLGSGGYAEAGYFNGTLFVVGSVIKTGGSFLIDHPTDPANKYLYHSFVESPDMMNVYNGIVFTDGGGHASVVLPDWFEALNRDFRYQLAVIGRPALVWVASEIANHSFTIRTDKPNAKVSWQVTGIRQDAWANAHRIPVEVDKPANDRGHYLYPELFGHAGDPSITVLNHPQPRTKH